MRGYQTPALRSLLSDDQSRFATLSRGRRSKLAVAAQTTLIKADQWARGAAVDAPVAEALAKALGGLTQKKK